MRLALRLAATGVAISSILLPVLSQSFPESPTPQWAYDALQRLRDDGLLPGYPELVFTGQRPLSRYEFAVAILAAYKCLKAETAGYSARLDELKTKIDELTAKQAKDGSSTSDVEALQTQVDAVKADLARMRSRAGDVDALSKLTTAFEQDLAALGVDTDEMKRDLVLPHG